MIATSGVECSNFFREATTFKQLGWDALTLSEWFGLFMPARTPPATVTRVGQSVARSFAGLGHQRDLRSFGLTIG